MLGIASYRTGVVLLIALTICPALDADENDEVEHGRKWLNEGFENQDTEPLVRFFDRWHERVGPVPAETLTKKPEFEREAYAVYGQFFISSERLAQQELKYVVVQRELCVTLVDNDLSDIFDDQWDSLDRRRALPNISRVTLHEFRPRISIQGAKVLYLDRDHLNELLQFLVEEPYLSHLIPIVDRYWDIHHGGDMGGVRAPDHSEKELAVRKEKLAYLNSVLDILPGHWGTGWHFETHPIAGNLVLSSDHQRAIVEFRAGYGGGEAYLKKDARGNWIQVSRHESWME